MGFAFEGEVFIPMEEFRGFVEKFLPDNAGAEWCLDTERIVCGDSDLVVKVAMNTECHPTQQATPPTWLQENSDKAGDAE